MSVRKNKGRRKTTLIIAVVGIALAVAAGFAMIGSSERRGASIAVSSAPEMIESAQRSLEPFRGKVVILNIWATWCGPCRVEIPDLIKLQDRYRDDGLEVIGVSIDPVDGRGGGAAAVGPFMQRYGINYTIWMVKNYDVLAGYPPGQGIPTTYVLDRDGRIVKTYVGAKPMSVFESDIKQLL